MTGPTSEQGTPVKKSKPAASSRSTNGAAATGAFSGRDLSACHFGPRPPVVLEAVDLHPALVDVRGHHRVPAVDQRLQDVREAAALEPLGTLRHQIGVHV